MPVAPIYLIRPTAKAIGSGIAPLITATGYRINLEIDRESFLT